MSRELDPPPASRPPIAGGAGAPSLFEELLGPGSGESSPGAPITGASPRVERWARAARLVRAPDHWNTEAVTRWARSQGISFAQALSETERALGGLVAPADPSAGDMQGRPLVALGFRWVAEGPPELVSSWKNASPESDPLELSSGVEEPVIRAYPRWAWRGHELVLIGQWRSRLLFCDARGAVWRLHGEAGAFDVVAGSARAALEQLAIEEELWREIGHYVPVRVLAASGAEAARALSLEPIAEASDDLVQTFEGSRLLVWQLQAYGPNVTEVRVVSADPERALAAVLAARAAEPGARVKVAARGSEAAGHIAALAAAGLGDFWSLTATPQEEAMRAGETSPSPP